MITLFISLKEWLNEHHMSFLITFDWGDWIANPSSAKHRLYNGEQLVEHSSS